MRKIPVAQQDDFAVGEETLICAFDFALGRAGQVAGRVVRDLLQNIEQISPMSRNYMLSKINAFNNLKKLGHENDKQQWLNLANRLQQAVQGL